MYGRKIKSGQKQKLHCPDFNLRYTGQVRIVPRLYPRGFACYNFVVSQGSKVQKLKWSSGTGAIEPQALTLCGKSHYAVNRIGWNCKYHAFREA